MNTTTHEIKGNLVEADEPFVEPKVGAAALMMAPRLSPLLRKFGKAALIYGISYLAVKALDKAATDNPKNRFAVGSDQIANVVFAWENLLVGGVVMIAGAGYDALTAPKVAPQPEPQKEIETAKTKPPAPKHHRNRANLNAMLMPDGAVAGSGKTSPDIEPPKALPSPRHQDFVP